MKRHFIYVIGREQGPVKVGITSSPGARLSTIQTGCPFKIEILHLRECRDRQHAIEHEEIFHGVYGDRRLAGEWFDISADLAIEGVDVPFDWEEDAASRAKQELMAAHLNIWPWAGEDGAHPHH